MMTTLSQGQQHRERERRHHGVTSIVDDQVLPLDIWGLRATFAGL